MGNNHVVTSETRYVTKGLNRQSADIREKLVRWACSCTRQRSGRNKKSRTEDGPACLFAKF